MLFFQPIQHKTSGGKSQSLKNILLGSSPMKKDDLAKKVGELREELTALKTQ
jgi:hypothetical protein